MYGRHGDHAVQEWILRSIGASTRHHGSLGSGKIDLMNRLAVWIRRPAEGTIQRHLVSDMSDDELARIRTRKIGFVFQTSTCCARHVAAQRELPLIYSGMPADKRLNGRAHGHEGGGPGIAHVPQSPTSSPADSASV